MPHLTKEADTKAAAKKSGKQTRKQRLKEEGATFVQAELELLTEYQTLRRMRRAENFILFTVRTYISPFENLQQAPGDAPATPIHSLVCIFEYKRSDQQLSLTSIAVGIY